MRPKLFKDLEQSTIKPNPYDIQKNWLHHSESHVTCYHRCPFLQWKNEKWRVLYSYNYLERIISNPFFASQICMYRTSLKKEQATLSCLRKRKEISWRKNSTCTLGMISFFTFGMLFPMLLDQGSNISLSSGKSKKKCCWTCFFTRSMNTSLSCKPSNFRLLEKGKLLHIVVLSNSASSRKNWINVHVCIHLHYL